MHRFKLGQLYACTCHTTCAHNFSLLTHTYTQPNECLQIHLYLSSKKDDAEIELQRNIFAMYTAQESDLDLAVSLVDEGNFSTALAVLLSAKTPTIQLPLAATEAAVAEDAISFARIEKRMRTLARVYEELEMFAEADELMRSTMALNSTAGFFSWMDLGAFIQYVHPVNINKEQHRQHSLSSSSHLILTLSFSSSSDRRYALSEQSHERSRGVLRESIEQYDIGGTTKRNGPRGRRQYQRFEKS